MVSPAGPGVGVLFTCGVGAAPLADMLSRLIPVVSLDLGVY